MRARLNISFGGGEGRGESVYTHVNRCRVKRKRKNSNDDTQEGPRARTRACSERGRESDRITRTDKELRRRSNRFLIYSDRSIINALIRCEMKACRRVNNTAASDDRRIVPVPGGYIRMHRATRLPRTRRSKVYNV